MVISCLQQLESFLLCRKLVWVLAAEAQKYKIGFLSDLFGHSRLFNEGCDVPTARVRCWREQTATPSLQTAVAATAADDGARSRARAAAVSPVPPAAASFSSLRSSASSKCPELCTNVLKFTYKQAYIIPGSLNDCEFKWTFRVQPVSIDDNKAFSGVKLLPLNMCRRQTGFPSTNKILQQPIDYNS